MIVPYYRGPQGIYQSKTNALVSFFGGLAAFFPLGVRPLLAILAVVAGLIGTVLGVQRRQWGWVVLAFIGFFFGVVVLTALATGQEF